MKWGAHQFAIFPSMSDGRKALFAKIETKPNLKAYLNYHLGQRKDGTFAEGNDPDSYLKHIQAKDGVGAVRDDAAGDQGQGRRRGRCSTAS